MEMKNFNTYFFFLILLVISVTTFFIFQPFLIAILLAAVFAIVFQRPYNFFVRLTNGRHRISAMLTSIMGILIFVTLFLGIVGMIASETSNLLHDSMKTGDAYLNYVNPLINSVNRNPFLRSIGLENLINGESINKAVSQFGQGAFNVLQQTYQSVAHFLFLVVVMFFTLYYFLVGGKELVKKIMFLSPLKDAHEKILIEKFISISRATVKGTLVVGIVQGTIGGIIFAIVGIPSAITWGVIMVFLSVIPMFGTSLVWFPAAIILLATGQIWQGVAVFSVGFGVISVIDNFLRPELVGKDTQMHPLVVFFATLGGISLLGFLGFIIGPIIVALFITLWDIYAVEFKGQLKRYNK
ncbi:MAG: AI-2E family transporter [Candidatus Moranbacteria bacterium]|nr:AI-2E family transporter [Candidatus Moranbacteria bacterium]